MIGFVEIEGTALEEFSHPRPVIATPPRYGDTRGFFSETWSRRRFAELGIDVDFVQDNHSVSRETHVVRGLHFQAPPHAQGKLVRVARGAVRDVAVDIRKGSPSFGRWCTVVLSAENGTQIYIPPGYLHGFATLETDTEVLYKCTDYYNFKAEGTVRFDDPELGIDWGFDPGAAVLSDKDRAARGFASFNSPFTYEGSVA